MAQPPRLIIGERRRGQVLLYDGYRYERNRTVHGRKIYWRCTDPMCREPLQTNWFVAGQGANINVIGPNRPLNHPHFREDDRIERQDFLQRVKDRIELDPSVTVRSAYEAELTGLPAHARQNAPTFEEHRSSLQRHRRAFVPPIPIDIYGVNIQGPWAQTWDGHRKLLSIDNILGVSIFASDAELRALSECQDVYIDGTFKTAPFPYNQIITIHGKYHGWTLPLVMAMSTGKRQNQYSYILREVKQAINNLTNNIWQPAMAITDFEVALVNAIQQELPQAQTRGCYFHYTQSLMRRVTELGLKPVYSANIGVQQVIRRMLALGYIPINNVAMVFVTYVAGPNVQQLIQQYPRLQDFIDYVDDTYISGPVFHIPFWNVYDRDMDSRTNNYSEGFFSKWNRALRVRHPNIWYILRRIKTEGELTKQKIRRANRGERRPKRKMKYRKLERRIVRLKRALRHGHTNLNRYWRATVYITKTYA